MSTDHAISRRDFLKAAGVAAAALAVTPMTRATGAVRRKPNIIIILADDLGYGDLGCYGSTTIATPNIDALAATGMRFADFHSNGAVCSPTRAALLTGRYPQRCGVEAVFRPQIHADKPGLSLEEVTFAEVLRSAGYATALFGKWHLGYPKEYNPVRQGFDTFRGFLSGNVDYFAHIDGAGRADWWHNLELSPERGYTTELITKHGIRYIEEHRAHPFCLYLAHAAPHFPYQGPQDRPERAAGVSQPGEGGREDKVRAYKEMIESLDAGVGRIVETVKRLSLDRDTFIVFCSDNGAQAPGSNRPFRGMKAELFEGGHRVPAIASWPGRITPGITSQTAMTMDLLPTFAAAAGVPLPAGRKLDGVDLLPVLLNGKSLAERTLFWRVPDGEWEKAARSGPWKLHVTSAGVNLYNLDSDPVEQHDRAVGEPARVAELQTQLTAWEDELRHVPRLA